MLRRYDGTPLRKYDAAMNDPGGAGRYVLHRVMEVTDTTCFLGYNCLKLEKEIPEDMIGAVPEFFYPRRKADIGAKRHLSGVFPTASGFVSDAQEQTANERIRGADFCLAQGLAYI